jgi:predicted nucleotidyltransferase
MYSRADVNRIVEEVLLLVSAEFPLKEAYLFGSYSHGKAGNYSDIDLALVSDKFEGSRFFDKKKLNKFLLKTSTDVEIHPFRPEDFTEDNPFVKEIKRTGIKIPIPS